MQPPQDIEIIVSLKDGDLTAYDTLFTKYYKPLSASAYFMLRDEQEAKDLVQTLFIDIWEKKLYLQFHDDVKSYLYRAVKNRCLNQLSKQKTMEKNYESFAKLQESETVETIEPLPDYYGQLRTALEDIAFQKRMAIQMVYIKGKKYQDAADEMGISINSFKTHLKSGLKILRFGVKKTKND